MEYRFEKKNEEKWKEKMKNGPTIISCCKKVGPFYWDQESRLKQNYIKKNQKTPKGEWSRYLNLKLYNQIINILVKINWI